jgi:hypothetical protein
MAELPAHRCRTYVLPECRKTLHRIDGHLLMQRSLLLLSAC